VAPVADTSREAMAEQYRDDRKLAARQSIYRFRRHRDARNFYDIILDLAGLDGDEVVVDVGCGNGQYLRALRRRGHRGAIAGFDLSPGMAAAASTWAPAVAADAERLPVRTSSADVALCPHMLYHVPDQAAAVAELRRMVRPGGRAVVVTNAAAHFAEVDELVAAIAGGPPLGQTIPFKMEAGEQVLRGSFDTIERHDFVGALDVTEADAIVDYVASVQDAFGLDDDGLEEAHRAVQATIDRVGAFEITTASGAFVCS
jgi:SAM-dependent methyltransferase